MLLAAGCGTEAHYQALTAVQKWAPAHGETGKITCTSGFQPPTGIGHGEDFLCIARRPGARCDELHAVRRQGSWQVSLLRRSVDCVLP